MVGVMRERLRDGYNGSVVKWCDVEMVRMMDRCK